MWATLSFLWTYWYVLLPVLPVVAGLLALAYFTRDWRALVLAAGVVLAVVYSGHLFKQGFDVREKQLRAEYDRILAERDATITALSEADKTRADADAAEIERLRKLADDTPENKNPGLPREVGQRIGKIK